MSKNWLRAFLISLIPLAILFCLGQAEDHLHSGVRVDKVLVRKKEHTLELLDHGKMLKKYKVALGGNPVGPKTQQGDHKLLQRRKSFSTSRVSSVNGESIARRRGLKTISHCGLN